MSQFDPGPIPTEVTPSYLQRLLLILANAVNNIDKTNIHPKRIAGDDLLKDVSTKLKKLVWTEWPIPLILPASVVSTTATGGTEYGKFFRWDPAKFPGMTWSLEAALAISDAASTATLELLESAGSIGSVSTQQTALTRVRSGTLTMPTTAQDLWVRLKTSNGAHTASLGAARLIAVPS